MRHKFPTSRRKLYLNHGHQPSKTHNSSHNSSVDDLFTVMQQAYSDDPLHRFVHAVNAAPELAVCSSHQFSTAKSCSFLNFQLLTVDPTFSLGEFDVTLDNIFLLFCYSHSVHWSCLYSLQENVFHIPILCVYADWSVLA